MKKQNQIIIYNTDDNKTSIALYSKDGQVWMNQKQLAELFETSKQNIGQHIASILEERELSANSVVKNYFTTASDGKEYSVTFYSLPMIIAIGFRVRSKRGTQFRIWANEHLHEYMVKGFVMDDERLKNPDGRPDYFDEMLRKIRDIRASEKRFYQKIRDLFKLSSDYDKTDRATQMFFAEAQNMLLYAVTKQTAAEIISSRAKEDEPYMGLTTWEGSKLRKADIIIAKNYLQEKEIGQLNRLVTIFLETAELRVQNEEDLTMSFWKNNLAGLLAYNNYPILNHKGEITKGEADKKAKLIYEAYNKKRKIEEAEVADQEDLEELRRLEQKLKNSGK